MRSSSKLVTTKEIAAVGRLAVHGERIDLVGRVDAANEAVPIAPSGVTPDDDDVSVPLPPFTLNADESTVEVEQHVVPSTFTNRSINVNAELCGVVHDRVLRDVSFLIGREHAIDPSRRLGWAVS